MRKHLRWSIVFMLFLAGTVSYLDRAAFAIVAPMIARDLALSPSELGWAFSAFFVGYALFCFVGGWAADRLGGKQVLTAAMLSWSMFCALTAAVATFPVLLLLRLFFGMGEGPFGSTATIIVSKWFPRHEQGRALGVANAGQPLGAALAGPVVGGLAAAYDWRAAFVVIGAVGVLWVWCWVRLATEKPCEHPSISREELSTIEHGVKEYSTAPSEAHPQRALWNSSVLAIAFAFFGFAYVLYFFLSWFPTYLSSVHGLGLNTMALLNVIPWAVGFLALGGGGFLTDHLFQLTGRAVFARKIVLVLGLGAAAVSVAAAGLVTHLGAAITLSTVAVFAMYLSTNTYFALILDLAPSGRVGTTMGFVHMIANCAGIVGPALTGYLVEWTGSFESAFFVTGAVAFAGALAVALCVPAPLRAVRLTREHSVAATVR